MKQAARFLVRERDANAPTMPIPDYQTLMLPLLRIAAQGETRVAIAADAIADQFALAEEDRDELLPSGRQRRLHNRVQWAKFYMSKAGLLDSPKRGVFLASDDGKALLEQHPDVINNETLKRYPSFVTFYAQSGSSEQPDEAPAANAAASSAALRKSRSTLRIQF